MIIAIVCWTIARAHFDAARWWIRMGDHLAGESVVDKTSMTAEHTCAEYGSRSCGPCLSADADAMLRERTRA